MYFLNIDEFYGYKLLDKFYMIYNGKDFVLITPLLNRNIYIKVARNTFDSIFKEY